LLLRSFPGFVLFLRFSSSVRLFAQLFAIMARFPVGLVDLSAMITVRTFSERVSLARSWRLLSSTGYCFNCNTATALRLPSSDDRLDPTIYTRCSNPDCGKAQGTRAGELHYAKDSIFYNSKLDLETTLLLVMCFALQLNPATTLRVIGGGPSNAAVQAFYRSIREKLHALMYHANGFIKEKIGGCMPADEAVAAPDGSSIREMAQLKIVDPVTRVHVSDHVARNPVEIDEGVCVGGVGGGGYVS
jgi:hypothetical protein